MALALGFLTLLPDASNKFLKMKQGSEVLGTSGGSDNFTLSRANLPNVTFSGRLWPMMGIPIIIMTDEWFGWRGNLDIYNSGG